MNTPHKSAASRTGVVSLIAVTAGIAQAQSPPACAPCPSGLLAWWPADASGVNVAGSGEARLENGASFAAGIAAQAFAFDGINDRVAVTEAPASDLSRQAAWTIQAWVRPTSLSNKAYPTIYSEGKWGISLGLNKGTGRLESWVNNANQLVGTVPLQVNTWSHVALACDGATRTFYVNGAYIVFDQQPAIATDWVDPHDPGKGIDPNKQALVTIDAEPPTSSALPLPAEVATRFKIEWSGDDGVGAGIVGYDVQSAEVPAEGSLDWKDWQLNTSLTGDFFEGELGKTYAFRRRAHDGVGYIEDWRDFADAQTIVTTQFQTNRPPVITPISDQILLLGATLNVQILATDPDEGQTLKNQLVTSPAGMFITDSKWIRWTPTDEQLGDSQVTVRVTDDGQPPLSAEAGFMVTVRELRVTWRHVESDLTLHFATAQGRMYRVEYTDDLASRHWVPLGDPQVGTGQDGRFELTIEVGVPQRFYRIAELP